MDRDQQGACVGRPDFAPHLQTSHEAGRNLGELQNKNIAVHEGLWRKKGLPLLTEKITNKIWTTMTGAVYDGDVPIMLALRSIFGWRTSAWWRSRSSWCMTWDPYNVQRWKHIVKSHNRGVLWDTPMARWAGEGKDWIQLMT